MQQKSTLNATASEFRPPTLPSSGDGPSPQPSPHQTPTTMQVPQPSYHQRPNQTRPPPGGGNPQLSHGGAPNQYHNSGHPNYAHGNSRQFSNYNNGSPHHQMSSHHGGGGFQTHFAPTVQVGMHHPPQLHQHHQYQGQQHGLPQHHMGGRGLDAQHHHGGGGAMHYNPMPQPHAPMGHQSSHAHPQHQMQQQSQLHHHQLQHAAASQHIPDRNQMRQPAAPLVSNAILCLASGPLEQSKSDLCRLIEEKNGYKHIALEDLYDDNGLVDTRLEILEKSIVALETAGTAPGATANKPRGYVIENSIARSEHEILLVDNILRRAKVRLQAVVLLNGSGVAEDDTHFIKHPVGFEMCARYLSGSDRLVVLGDEAKDGASAYNLLIQDRPNIFDFSSEQLPQEIDAIKDEHVLFNPSQFSLVRDSKLNFHILRAVATKLSFTDCFASYWTSPARVLEYSFYTRRSHYLRSFFASIHIEGDRVALIGYNKQVFVVSTPVGLCFRVDPNCLPSKLVEAAAASASELSFILLAVIAPSRNSTSAISATIHISDVLLLNDRDGKKLFAYERQLLLNSLFPAGGVMEAQGGLQFRVVNYFPIENVASKLPTNEPNGVTLINPGFPNPGAYERQNFVWWTGEYKTLDVRLWNGHTRTINNEEYWFFDALVLDGHEERKLTSSNEAPLFVVIADSKVSTDWINDGNVVEVRRHEEKVAATPAGVGKGRGSAAAAMAARSGGAASSAGTGLPLVYLEYVKRRPLLMYPTSRVFADVLTDVSPKWPKDAFVRSAAYLKHLPITRTITDEYEDEKG